MSSSGQAPLSSAAALGDLKVQFAQKMLAQSRGNKARAARAETLS